MPTPSATSKASEIASFSRYALSIAKNASIQIRGPIGAHITHYLRTYWKVKLKAQRSVEKAWESSTEAGLGAIRGAQLSGGFERYAPGSNGAAQAVAGAILLGGERGAFHVESSARSLRSACEAAVLLEGISRALAIASRGIDTSENIFFHTDEERDAVWNMSHNEKQTAIENAARILPILSRSAARVGALGEPVANLAESLAAFLDYGANFAAEAPNAEEAVMRHLPDCDPEFLRALGTAKLNPRHAARAYKICSMAANLAPALAERDALTQSFIEQEKSQGEKPIAGRAKTL